MNLYIFFESNRSAVYGIGTYIRELTDALCNCNDIKVCVVNLMSDRPAIQKEKINGVQYWYFPSILPKHLIHTNNKYLDLYYGNVAYLLKLYIKDRNNLVFHFNNNHNNKLGEEIKKSFDCRIITTVHYFGWGLLIYDNLQRFRKILNNDQQDSFAQRVKESFEVEKKLFSISDCVVCLSNYMRDILQQEYGINSAKISVISNGLAGIAKTKWVIGKLKRKWNVPVKEKIILFAGRLDEVKGLSYLIKAFKEILNNYPKCRLVIAGDGNYTSYTKESQDICMNVTYTGLLDKFKLFEWYNMADIGVVPSLFEPFGYVAVEMMMNDLPVVATETSGLNEVVDNTCGIKVPLIGQPETVEIDTSLLAQKILYLLQHPVITEKIGQCGRKRYLEHYSIEIFRKNMINLYLSL